MKSVFMQLTTLLCLASAGLAGGCLGDAEPPPEAVLEGDWATTLPADREAILSFDATGALVRIDVRGADGTTAGRDIRRATTTLAGDDVTVQVPLGGTASATFTGKLSADRKTMVGELSQQIDVDVPEELRLPAGALTLVRTADCNANDEYDHRDIATGVSRDCNGNGTPDECDIADGTVADSNENGVPDSCETE